MKTLSKLTLAVAAASIFISAHSAASINPTPRDSPETVTIKSPSLVPLSAYKTRLAFRALHGTYDLSDGRALAVYTSGTTPMISLGNELDIALQAISAKRYTSKDGRFTLDFNEEGATVRVTLAQNVTR